MNDQTNQPGDFDDDIASAFAPLRSAETPDLWDRIETSSSFPENVVPKTGWLRRRPVLAAAAALLVAISGFAAVQSIRTDDPIDVVDVPTTVTTTTTPDTTTPTSTPNTTTPPDVPLLQRATWVRVDFEAGALITNRGQTYLIDNVSFGAGQAIRRLPDGTVAVATGDGVIAFDQTSSEPELLHLGAATALARNESGELVVMTDDGPINLQSGEPEAEMPSDVRQSIVRENGFSVQVIPGEYETINAGEVSRVITPDALRLLFNGEQSDVWQFGGPAEYRVVLDDFNGRYLLAHRRPDEPALPPSEHVVIDIFGGTSESFVAIPGTVALALPNTDERPSSFSVGRLELCPTMSGSVLLKAPSELSSAASSAFDRTALGVTRCDETWLRSVFQGGTWDDTVWSHISTALSSVPSRTEAGWLLGEGTSATVSIGDDGDTAVSVVGGVFELRIIKRDEAVVLAGSVGPETAAGLRSAANAHIGATGRVSDFALSENGAEMGDDLRQAVEEMIGTGFRRSINVEALVTPTLVRVISLTDFVTDGELTAPAFERAGVTVEASLLSVEPNDVERATIDALQGFAAGGPLDPDIRWADEIVIGAGSSEGKRLTPGDMSTRSNWLIENVPFFRAGGEDAFTALRVVSEPGMIGGAHPHCASPPVPAPASLAGLRRVSIQPSPDSIDSCLQWITFDVFFNSDGRVAGVTVDYYEP